MTYKCLIDLVYPECQLCFELLSIYRPNLLELGIFKVFVKVINQKASLTSNPQD